MKGRVLVVDDQFGIRMLLNEVFKMEGYETFLASNGIDALSLLKETSPDLVFLDMKIPGMDGMEILKRMKEQNNDVKVVMMTAYGELNLINEAKNLGAIDYLSKPFNIDHVIAYTKKYIHLKVN